MTFLYYGHISQNVQSVLKQAHVRDVIRSLYDHGMASPGLKGTPPFDLLVREDFLKEVRGAYIPGDKLVIVRDGVLQKLALCAEESAESYAAVLAGEIPKLRRLYESMYAATVQGYTWTRVCHVIVAGLLMDVVVGQQIYHSVADSNRYPKAWIWVFCEPASRTSMRFGVHILYRGDRRIGLGYLWYDLASSSGLIVNEEDIEFISILLQGSQRCIDREAFARAILKLAYHRIVKRAPRGYSITVPVFYEGEITKLLKTAVRIANQVIPNIVVPSLMRLQDLIEKENIITYTVQQLFYRFLMESALTRLVAQGCLARLTPAASPAEFWIWMGDPLVAYFSRP
ncbi:MAG: hypothetical protein DDT19_01209 [Syntrophomonadaceae bacterium]|nr:hypothetical protein [Bacillota bacterium]